jgi:hypothetical protein
MAAIDQMRPAFRDLVREFGFVIVRDMLNDGYADADELRGILEGWRARRQAEWLATDFVTKRTAKSIAAAIVYRQANEG